MPDPAYVSIRELLYEAPLPERVRIEESEADVLGAGRGFMEAFDLTLQLMVGCPGKCLFCYVIEGHCMTPAAVRGPGGRDWGYVIRYKKNAIDKFRKHLYAGHLADKALYWSGVTDPYADRPATTHALWQALNEAPAHLRPRRLVVQTRFGADRDADQMATYNTFTKPADGGPAVVISMSMGTDREDLISAWEGSTPSFASRLKAIRALREAGLFVVATLSPLGLWNDLIGTMQQLCKVGVAYVTILFFKEGAQSANTPKPFLSLLRSEYPMLLEQAWQIARVQEVQSVFGEQRVLVEQPGFSSLAAPQAICMVPAAVVKSPYEE